MYLYCDSKNNIIVYEYYKVNIWVIDSYLHTTGALYVNL